MKYCNNCGVSVNSNENHCPLCFNQVEQVNEAKENPIYNTHKEKPRNITQSHKTLKVFILLSIFAIAVCAYINYVTKTPAWSAIVALSILYLWILVEHTILSHRSTFEKIFLQLVGVVALLCTTNMVSGGGWLIEYVLPSVLTFVMIVLNMVLFTNKRRKRLEISFFIIEFIILIVAIVFVSANFASFKLLYWITLLTSALSIIGIILFDGRNLRQELSKLFHL